jgi:hypothetical protein
MRIIGLTFLMIPVALVAFIGALVVTNLKHGIPLYLHWLITLRTRLLLDAIHYSENWTARAVKFLDWDTQQLVLDANALLATTTVVEEEGSIDQWEVVPDSMAGVGFEIVTDTIELASR